jgi:hypothetical protein
MYRDRFAVIAQKAEHRRAGSGSLDARFDQARYGSFRDRETQHEQLAMNPRSTPSRVLGDHLKYQIPDLLGHGRCSHLPPHP